MYIVRFNDEINAPQAWHSATGWQPIYDGEDFTIEDFDVLFPHFMAHGIVTSCVHCISDIKAWALSGEACLY